MGEFSDIEKVCYNGFSDILNNERGEDMRIALLTTNLNETVEAQVKQIDEYLSEFLSVDLLCLGNAYLMGETKLTGVYEDDLEIALNADCKEILLLREIAKKRRCGLGFGFVEKDDEGYIYNSYMLIDGLGNIVSIQRSINDAWKPNDNEMYANGKGYNLVNYKGLTIAVASYGDLEHMDNILTLNSLNPDAVLWPISLEFNPTEWRNEGLNELATQLKIIKPHILLVNTYSDKEGLPSGGAYMFHEGHVMKELPLGNTGILIVSAAEIQDNNYN